MGLQIFLWFHMEFSWAMPSSEIDHRTVCFSLPGKSPNWFPHKLYEFLFSPRVNEGSFLPVPSLTYAFRFIDSHSHWGSV